ncbi:MAG: type II secretion system F family protein [Planctomycetota bacterium]
MDPSRAIFLGVGLVGMAIWVRLFVVRNRVEFRARLCEVLAAAVKRELPLATLVERTRADYRGERGRALMRLQRALDEGRSLPDALRLAGRRFFPRQSVAVLEAADGSAALPGALRAVSVASERRLDLRHRGLVALAYPAVLMLILPVMMQVNSKLFTWYAWHEVGNGVNWVLRMHAVSQWTLYAIGGLAAVWVLFGAWLPYPGKRLFGRERRLRAAAATLRAGGGWRAAFPAFDESIGAGAPAESALAPLRLPADLQARLVAATTQGPKEASDALTSLADECARRATASANRGLRCAQLVLLLVIAFIAAAQFAGIFSLEHTILREVGPW